MDRRLGKASGKRVPVDRAFGTLQDRLPKELKLAGIASLEQANAFIREVYLPVHNASFAVAAAQPGSAFTPIPGVDLDEILCVEEERQVMNDNCVSYRTLKLQIPPSPLLKTQLSVVTKDQVLVCVELGWGH